MNVRRKDRENYKQKLRKWMKEGRKQEKETLNLSSYSPFKMVHVFSNIQTLFKYIGAFGTSCAI